jgi:hypothetical protein
MKSCKKCRRPLELRQDGHTHGSFGDVEVELVGLSYLGCPDDHTRIFPYADFGAEFRPQLSRELAAAHRSVLSWRYRCKSCGARLPERSRQPRQFDIDLRLRDPAPLLVKLRLPAETCVECGTAQTLLTRQLDNDISEALLDAFERIGRGRTLCEPTTAGRRSASSSPSLHSRASRLILELANVEV